MTMSRMKRPELPMAKGLQLRRANKTLGGKERDWRAYGIMADFGTFLGKGMVCVLCCGISGLSGKCMLFRARNVFQEMYLKSRQRLQRQVSYNQDRDKSVSRCQ